MTLATVWTLLGAQAEDCTPPQPPVAACDLECEHGMKADSDGTTYCECRESAACIEIYPPPSRDPETGECKQFPTVCDIPEGWEACQGCHDGEDFYEPGDAVPNGCYSCVCRESGDIECEGPAGGDCDGGPEALCEITGGNWHEETCGHYLCGEPAATLCDPAPGCDCGEGRSFHYEAGCFTDPSCSGTGHDECWSSSECDLGEACVLDCAGDACARHCAPIVCSFDADCPAGSYCAGSSVCPPNATCIWEGEPGTCAPLCDEAPCDD